MYMLTYINKFSLLPRLLGPLWSAAAVCSVCSVYCLEDVLGDELWPLKQQKSVQRVSCDITQCPITLQTSALILSRRQLHWYHVTLIRLCPLKIIIFSM